MSGVLGAEIDAWLLKFFFQLFSLLVQLLHLLIELLLKIIDLRLQKLINDRANLLFSLLAIGAAVILFLVCFEGLHRVILLHRLLQVVEDCATIFIDFVIMFLILIFSLNSLVLSVDYVVCPVEGALTERRFDQLQNILMALVLASLLLGQEPVAHAFIALLGDLVGVHLCVVIFHFFAEHLHILAAFALDSAILTHLQMRIDFIQEKFGALILLFLVRVVSVRLVVVNAFELHRG